LFPDLVFFMKIEPRAGLRRLSSERDRIEGEADEFHDRVSAAYLELARRFPERVVVLDAGRSPGEIHEEVVAAFVARTSAPSPSPVPDIGPPGGPVPV
jgi:dTMP kinase